MHLTNIERKNQAKLIVTSQVSSVQANFPGRRNSVPAVL